MPPAASNMETQAIGLARAPKKLTDSPPKKLLTGSQPEITARMANTPIGATITSGDSWSEGP